MPLTEKLRDKLIDLYFVDLNHQNLNDEDFIEVCEILKEHGDFNSINLMGNSITNINELKKLNINLKKLNLSCTDITEIPNLQILNNLVKLDFSINHLKNIDDIKNFTKLESLNLHAALKGLDISKMEFPLALKYLDLSANEIRKLPNLSSLTNLQFLDIGDNDITEIESIGVSKLVNLEKLYVSECGINSIDSIASLKKLKGLDIYSTNISDFKFLLSLTTLEDLGFDSTKFIKYENDFKYFFYLINLSEYRDPYYVIDKTLEKNLDELIERNKKIKNASRLKEKLEIYNQYADQYNVAKLSAVPSLFSLTAEQINLNPRFFSNKNLIANLPSEVEESLNNWRADAELAKLVTQQAQLELTSQLAAQLPAQDELEEHTSKKHKH